MESEASTSAKASTSTANSADSDASQNAETLNNNEVSTSAETSTGTYDTQDDMADDSPDLVSRISVPDGPEEEFTDHDDNEDVEENDIFVPVWKKDSEKNINAVRSRFEKTKFDQPFGAKVGRIDTNNVLSIFFLFFNLTIAQLIVQQTVLYASQKGHTIELSVSELNAFIGMLVIMGFNQLPSLRLYWSSNPNFGNVRISKVMPLKRFLLILRMLHLNDNTTIPDKTSPEFDKLYSGSLQQGFPRGI